METRVGQIDIITHVRGDPAKTHFACNKGSIIADQAHITGETRQFQSHI